MKKKIVIFLVLVMSISLFSGCFRTLKTKDGSISLKGGNLEITGKDGGTTTVQTSDNSKGSSLPDKYPKDVMPIIDGGKIILSSKNTNNGKVVFSVMYESKEEMSKAAEYYKKVMENAEELNTMESEDLVLLTGNKDKYKANVAVTAEADDEKEYKSVVTIGLEEQ